MIEFRIVSYGDRLAAERLEALGLRAHQTRPAMEEIYLTILDIEQEIFERDGARGGDLRWAPLTPQWVAEKQRRNMDPRILRMSGRLEDSVTKYHHPDQYARIERYKIVFNSKLPYARIHQKGSSAFHRGGGSLIEGGGDFAGQAVSLGEGIPPRPFIKFTNSDARAFAREISRYLVGKA